MTDRFSHQTNAGKTVNVAGDHTVIHFSDEPQTRRDHIHPDVRRLFTSLKERYQNRYEQKLDDRLEITLEVSEEFDDQQPQKFTERHLKDAKVSEAFPAISKAFESKGRLLIVGSPGAGKTVLLLKLALNLLNKTDLATQEAFPVIFNLASWTEKYKSFEEWLVAMLVSGYGLSKNFATMLLHQGKIVFLLDGLDELARNQAEKTAHHQQAKCLDSLNDFLRCGRKAVICCRRQEFIEMRRRTGQDAPVSSKIEILDLAKADIIKALRYAQEGNKNSASANNLLKIIETNEVFLEVLSTPFYFTIALEVFDKQLWMEKDYPGNVKEIKEYLRHRFVESKLRHSPNPNNFQAEKTKGWLKWLAIKLDEYSSTLFELSDLHLTDISAKDARKKIKTIWSYRGDAILAIFLYNFFQVLLGKVHGLFAFVTYVVVWFTFFKVSLSHFDSFLISTEDIISLDLRRFRDSDFWIELLKAMLQGASRGFAIALLFLLIVKALTFVERLVWGNAEIELSGVVIPTGIIVGALASLFIITFANLKKVKEFASLERPYQRLFGGLSSRLLFSVFVVVFFLMGMAIYEFQLRNGYLRPYYEIYIILVVFPLSYIFLTLLSLPMMRHLILRADLYRLNKMPLKYATFLDYAVSLRILERDGGHWRFRHQELQEHFATLNVRIDLDQDRNVLSRLIRRIRVRLQAKRIP